LLPACTYVLTQTVGGPGEDMDATGDLDVWRSVIIMGTGATPPVITAGEGWADRILKVLTGTATLRGLTA
jgi:hypothetical protein